MFQFRQQHRPGQQTPWGRVRRELSGRPLRRHRPSSEVFHSMHCACRRCRLDRDPTGASDRTIVKLQAVALLAFLILLYALALFFAPEIALAFATAPTDIAIAGATGEGAL